MKPLLPFLPLLLLLGPDVRCAPANKRLPKSGAGPPGPRTSAKPKWASGSTAVPASGAVTQLRAPALQHDTCLGYYDVSGQFDKEFGCNNTDHRFCCGSCFLRFCCADRAKRLEQTVCTNYNTPDWVKTQPPSPAPTGDSYDPELDRTNTTVYISCGVVALVVAVGISAKVAYDKATKTPQEMNVHRALADILRQQGPVPISQYEQDNMDAMMNGSPKDETPVRSSKNNYTPVHANHGHYGMETIRSGGADMLISSGFVTLGRGHLKAQHPIDESAQISWQNERDLPVSYGNHHHHHDYQHSHVDLTALTPKLANRHGRHERAARPNNILTAATEPYDLSLSRSFQNLSHMPSAYELALSSDLSDKEVDDFYSRKHHQADLGGRGHTRMAVLNDPPPLHHHQHHQQQHQQRQRPRRVQRTMSQDHVLSPPRTPRRGDCGLSSYGNAAATAYGSNRHPSEELLLSAERLRSQDPLLSPAIRRDKFRQKAMARAMSHADMLIPTTPVHERHRMGKMLSEPSDAYNTFGVNTLSVNTLGVNTHASAAKRQAFASRRTHTVDHLQFAAGHHHGTNEVTV
ncbi:protein shisa-6-like isoform X1 [Phyllopteryx taeniolatus]|uniref:protein shisa-6-like isoform X1 n=1 Tax=Phyllopteryx taeniolatus TaxID=161469 RepID=UPI002AD3244A|nr:protein shisa-6-like isoform X1 [Phyllopteryx taeniolatus]XP_061604069.1 protein shisa-6-like isoform X1 [Phyllopteryx taeniolatus]XP_061604070.1 protein shisa-6-like isoform X1 [Phyllopteryx taeniolatus]XP_061604071.1 protein shisa-6-like isoform X1 [Phyllopteryx taeniolatus]XP_061604072.1 protein shisa-6-like isoform X1 [Phyllopteryx taeniolatus]XP_061604073.1 protein shisa-6-like isoform X1 [Phyllopteryx taeniolatus]XP_061604074.1 protein shisa-6-like isoform X1 [Phyllopteryx taeniolatu